MQLLIAVLLVASASAFSLQSLRPKSSFRSSTLKMQGDGLMINMKGKTVFVAGVADSTGYGWAIAKACAEAGATIVLGTWPPVLPIFQMGIDRGQFVEDQKLSNGKTMEIAKIYPLDATFDTKELIPEEVAKGKRYKQFSGYSIQEVADSIKADFGGIDYMVHSLANGPEVTKPLLETSRAGYLAASSASAYSLVSMVSRFAPIMKTGGSIVSLTYMASEKVIPGYGGGMSSAKAQLESDTRVLAFEAGRKYGIRVNTISAGPLASRAAKAIGGASFCVALLCALLCVPYCLLSALSFRLALARPRIVEP